MIKLYLSGRLGNQLFQVAFAYLLARKSKQKIIIKLKSDPNQKYWLGGFNSPVFLSFLPSVILKKVHKVLFKFYLEDLTLKNHYCLDSVEIPLQSYSSILLDGYFQDARLLAQIKIELSSIFKLRKKYQKIFENKYIKFVESKSLVINLRLREYNNHYFEEIKNTPYINPTWYYNILESINLEQFKYKIIISDDIEHAKLFLSSLQHDYIFIDDEWFIDFQFLLYGSTLIIPNSSFSWWGAFLNSKPDKCVYAPKNWVGNNAGIEYPKGIMIEDFIWV